MTGEYQKSKGEDENFLRECLHGAREHVRHWREEVNGYRMELPNLSEYAMTAFEQFSQLKELLQDIKRTIYQERGGRMKDLYAGEEYEKLADVLQEIDEMEDDLEEEREAREEGERNAPLDQYYPTASRAVDEKASVLKKDLATVLRELDELLKEKRQAEFDRRYLHEAYNLRANQYDKLKQALLPMLSKLPQGEERERAMRRLVEVENLGDAAPQPGDGLPGVDIIRDAEKADRYPDLFGGDDKK